MLRRSVMFTPVLLLRARSACVAVSRAALTVAVSLSPLPSSLAASLATSLAAAPAHAFDDANTDANTGNNDNNDDNDNKDNDNDSGDSPFDDGGGGDDGGDGAVVAAPAVAALAPADALVFTGDELVRRGYRTLGEALAFETGVVRRQSGAGPRYALFGVDSGIALIVDGVPVVVDGERDVLDVDDTLDLQDVLRVEIVKGPATAFAGPGALTGTVRVTTKRPGLTGATVRTSASAFASTDALPIAGERAVSAEGAVRDGALAARASLRLNAGSEQLWRLRAVPVRFERVAGAALPVRKVDVDVVPADDTTINGRLGLAWGDVYVDVGAVRDLDQQPLSSFSHGLVLDARAEQRERERVFARGLWQGQLGPVHVETTLNAAHQQKRERVPLFPAAGTFDNGGVLVVDVDTSGIAGVVRADAAVYDGHRVLLAVFGDVTHAVAASSATDPVSGADSDNAVAFDDVSASGNGALEYQGDFGAGLHLTAGVVGFARTGFQPGVSPRLALLWRNDAIDVDVRYSEGTRTPDRFDIAALASAVVDGRVVGADENRNLRPELVRTLQLSGGVSPTSALRVSTRVFGLRHEDAIVQREEGARLRPENRAPRHLLGGELTGDVVIDHVHDAGVRGGLAYVAALDDSDDHDDNDNDDNDDDLTGATATIDAHVAPLAPVLLGLRGRARLGAVSSAAIVDGYASVSLSDHASVSCVVRNVFDADDAFDDDHAPPFADPVAFPSAGRTLVFSLEARF